MVDSMPKCECGCEEFHIHEISLGIVEVCTSCGEQRIYLNEV